MENSKLERSLPLFCLSPFLTLEFVSDFEIRISGFSALDARLFGCGFAALRRIAGLHPAARRRKGTVGICRSLADDKSAIRQIDNLRYGKPKAALASRPIFALAPACHFQRRFDLARTSSFLQPCAGVDVAGAFSRPVRAMASAPRIATRSASEISSKAML